MTTDVGDPTGYVRGRLEEACQAIELDVDAEWHHLQGRIAREGAVVGGWSPPANPIHSPAGRFGRYGPALLAAVAAALLVTVAARPVTVRIVVDTVVSARDAMLGRADPPPVIVEATTTTVPPTTTTMPPTTTTTPPPPATTVAPTTVETAPAIGDDPAHEAIVNGDEYRLTIRRVHEQLNDAIGYSSFRPENYGALAGSDQLIESLLGQRPEFDLELRNVIGHLRQAQRASDRNAASAAHSIISSIETRLAAEG